MPTRPWWPVGNRSFQSAHGDEPCSLRLQPMGIWARSSNCEVTQKATGTATSARALDAFAYVKQLGTRRKPRHGNTPVVIGRHAAKPLARCSHL